MAQKSYIFAPLRGMALLMVLVSLALISAVVMDLLVDQNSSYQVALRQRDALKAEALAESGVNLAQLFLTIQGPIQSFFTKFASMGVPLPKHTIWGLLTVDSSLFSGLISGDLATNLGVDVSESIKKRKEEKKKKLEDAAREREHKTHGEEGNFIPPEGGFGSFEGSFRVELTDEESKISFRKWTDVSPADRYKTRKLLLSLMADPKYDIFFKKVSRIDLIAHIFDYLDTDEIRIDPNATAENWGNAFGGSEKEFYLNLKNINPKNAYFDSLGELNLVYGFTDRHYDAFAEALTIYGEDRKINILSAKEPVIGALARYCANNDSDPNLLRLGWVSEAVKKWTEYKNGGAGPVSPAGFVQFLSALPLSINKKECQDMLGVESKNFTLKSYATVNGVSRTMTLVARIFKGEQERYYFVRGQ